MSSDNGSCSQKYSLLQLVDIKIFHLQAGHVCIDIFAASPL